MNENDISREIVDACFEVHNELGPGLLESVYEEFLAFELADQRGLEIKRQVGIPVRYKNKTLDLGFRADMLINNKVLIELKSVEEVLRVHKKQVLTYLRISGLKLGLLVNFNVELIKHGITRLVNKL